MVSTRGGRICGRGRSEVAFCPCRGNTALTGKTVERGARVTVTSSAGGGRGSRQPHELGVGLERVRGAAGLGSRRKSGGIGQTGAPSWGGRAGPVSGSLGAAARARGSALPPRPRRQPGSWARGCGPLGSWAPGGVLRPRSPRARTLPGAAPGAGGTWPVLHLAVAGEGQCQSPSEAAGRWLKVAPKETEVRPSGREEATVRCGTGPGKPRGRPGAGQGGGVSVLEGPAPGPGATFPQDHIRRAAGGPQDRCPRQKP